MPQAIIFEYLAQATAIESQFIPKTSKNRNQSVSIHREFSSSFIGLHATQNKNTLKALKV